MAYDLQKFTAGEVLLASQLNNMDAQIASNTTEINTITNASPSSDDIGKVWTVTAQGAQWKQPVAGVVAGDGLTKTNNTLSVSYSTGLELSNSKLQVVQATQEDLGGVRLAKGVTQNDTAVITGGKLFTALGNLSSLPSYPTGSSTTKILTQTSTKMLSWQDIPSGGSSYGIMVSLDSAKQKQTISLTSSTTTTTIDLTPFTGITSNSSTIGTTGLVPKPTSNDVNKFLNSDGTWQPVVTTSGDGTGDMLASVYADSANAGYVKSATYATSANYATSAGSATSAATAASATYATSAGSVNGYTLGQSVPASTIVDLSVVADGSNLTSDNKHVVTGGVLYAALSNYTPTNDTNTTYTLTSTSSITSGITITLTGSDNQSTSAIIPLASAGNFGLFSFPSSSTDNANKYLNANGLWVPITSTSQGTIQSGYTLPAATSDLLGGIIIGGTLTISNSVADVNYGTGLTYDSSINKLIADASYISITAVSALSTALSNKLDKPTTTGTNGQALVLNNGTPIWSTVTIQSITLDDTITENGTNAVKNGAIFTALKAKQDSISVGYGLSFSGNKIDLHIMENGGLSVDSNGLRIPYATNTTAGVIQLGTGLVRSDASKNAYVNVSLPSAGNTTTPIYISSDGTPTAFSYTLGQTVPSNTILSLSVASTIASGNVQVVTGGVLYNAISEFTKLPTMSSSGYVLAINSSVNGVEWIKPWENVTLTPTGTSTTPIYINASGTPVALEYTIEQAIPAASIITLSEASLSTIDASNKTIITGGNLYTALANHSSLPTLSQSLSKSQILQVSTNKSWYWVDMPTIKEYDAFYGATSESDGLSGLVKQPTSADYSKYLCGNGSWQTITIPQQTTYYAGSYINISTDKTIDLNAATPTVGYALTYAGSNKQLSWTSIPTTNYSLYYTSTESNAPTGAFNTGDLWICPASVTTGQYSITLSSTNWISATDMSTSVYYAAATIDGMAMDLNVICSLGLPSTIDGFDDLVDAYAKIYRIDQHTNLLYFYTTQQPTMDLPVQVMIVA